MTNNSFKNNYTAVLGSETRPRPDLGSRSNTGPGPGLGSTKSGWTRPGLDHGQSNARARDMPRAPFFPFFSGLFLCC